MTPGLGIPCSILLSYGRDPAELYGSVARRGKLARRGLLLGLAATLVVNGAAAGERVTRASVEGPDRLRLEDGRLVRLLGLVVPGDLSPAPDGPERVAAARRRLEELLAEGAFDLEVQGEDRLGRVLGKMRTADGRLVQRELVAAGLAWAFPDGLDRPSARELLAAESEARDARRGLWAEPSLAVQDADRVTAEPPRFALVEGTVVRIGRSEAFTWLGFGAGRRRDFTVRIPATALPTFRRAGLPPDRLLGRRLRVRGWLFGAGGAIMEVEEALQIEVLE